MMDTEKLHDLVNRYQENQTYITNEETAKMALVVPFVRHLGYDPNNPREVRLEYRADFAQNDGKRLPDRMDFAIFDSSGQKPLMVIETKPLGTDLQSNSNQLARYVAQLPDLHFGIITDGCHYLFFGDLESPNRMDKEPFFTFSLNDVSTDWAKVAKFLAKFSRESFNAETLITDAEDSRYRQSMIDRLVMALKDPGNDEDFLKWLTKDIYKGKRTNTVLVRLGNIAKESVEPSILRLMSGDFLEKLRDRMDRLQDLDSPRNNSIPQESSSSPQSNDETDEKRGIVTTEEELELFKIISDICAQSGYSAEDILWRDTMYYFNISYKRPTKWFVRFFVRGDKRAVVTYVPVEEATRMAPDFTVDEAPSGLGVSRIQIESVAQLWAIKDVVIASLRSLEESKESENTPTNP